MTTSTETRECPTCERTLPADAFYRGCAECKACKRKRSKENRIAQTRKVAAFERFVEVFIDIARRSPEPRRTSRLNPETEQG